MNIKAAKNLERFEDNSEVYVIVRERPGKRREFDFAKYHGGVRPSGWVDCFSSKEVAKYELAWLACSIFENKDFSEYSKECDFTELMRVVREQGCFEDDGTRYYVWPVNFREQYCSDIYFPIADPEELADAVTRILEIDVDERYDADVLNV